MTQMTGWEKAFITNHRVARLATVDGNNHPHVVPIVYAFDGKRLYTPIDKKPKRVGASRLQRVRNIQANARVAVVIDDYSEDWRQLAWVQIRGSATIVEGGPEHATAVGLLQAKYPQYGAMTLHDRPIIVITPNRIVSWSGGEADGSLPDGSAAS